MLDRVKVAVPAKGYTLIMIKSLGPALAMHSPPVACLSLMGILRRLIRDKNTPRLANTPDGEAAEWMICLLSLI